MKKRSISFYCSILFLFCQVMTCSGVSAMTEVQILSVRENCEVIRDNLRRVQREDSVVRTHIGPYYNTVLEKFVKPLNLRLVENNMFNNQLFETQGTFATAFEVFRNDYSDYQRGLEELILIDCAAEPIRFYEKLEEVRGSRKTVSVDTVKMRRIVSEQKVLVEGLRSKL